MKRILCMVMLLAVFMSVCTPFAVASGEPSEWAVAEINSARNVGLMTDNVAADFKANITREQFCELAMLLYEKMSGKTAPTVENKFTDTNNEEIIKAFGLGIVNGISETEFAPDKNITRQELATMLVRTIQAADVYKANLNSPVEFADSDSISDWAEKNVQYVHSFGVMKGVGDNLINPLGNTTCEQAVLLVYRTFNIFNIEVSEEEVEAFESELNALGSIVEATGDYADENGRFAYEDAETVYELAKAEISKLKENGEIKEAYFDDKGKSCLMVTNLGEEYLYSVPIAETFGSVENDKFELLTINTVGDFESISVAAFDSWWKTVHAMGRNMIDKSEDTYEIQSIHDGTCTVNNLKEYLADSNTRVILWRGHGVYNLNRGGAGFCLEESCTPWKEKLYEAELDSKQVVKTIGIFDTDIMSTYCVMPDFFRANLASRDDGLFFATSCYTGMDRSMADVFISKGFDSYIAPDDSINVGFADGFMLRFTEELCEKEDETKDKLATVTADKALQETRAVRGATDKDNVGFAHYTKGGEDFRFIESWRTAYAKFLREIAKKYTAKDYRAPRFELAYVTDDDVPELILLEGSSHMDGAKVYTFHKNKVVQINYEKSKDSRFGIYGTFHYKEREGQIYCGNMQHGYENNAIYEIKKNIAYTKYSLGNDEGAVGSEFGASYWEGSKDISKTEYDLKFSLYGFDSISKDFKRIEYGDAKRVEVANIEAVLEN